MKHVSLVFLILVCYLFCNTLTRAMSGPSNVIRFSYDLKQGVFSVWKGNEVQIQDAVSYVFLLKNNKTVRTDDPQLIRKVEKSKFKDTYGHGAKYSYISSNKEGIQLIQHFYQYANKPYLLIQVEVRGNQLSTNEIVSIYSDKALSKKGQQLYQVITPFDNDEFISYVNLPLSTPSEGSSEVGILLDKNSDSGLVIGSLDQSEWKSGVFFSGNNSIVDKVKVLAGFTNKKLTHDDMPHGALSGDKILSPKYFIASSTDWRSDMEDFAKLHTALNTKYVNHWESATPVGWNSWGVIQSKIDFTNATGVVDYFNNEIPFFRNDDGDAYIDLDSFWDNMTPGGMEGDYSKLKEFVKYCESKGLKAGVYLAPFTDWGHGGGPNRSVLKGSNYKYGDIWTKTHNGYHDLDGGRAIDPTHPGTKERISFILDRLVDCGFRMIKIDFLSHAAIESVGFYDQTITTGMQAYSVGMKHIVDKLQGKLLIYAAISPSLGSAKYVHMRRIACDAWNTIDQTQYTLNSISYGWYQTYMYNFIDADHLVFHGQSREVNRARLVSGLVTGPIILGDDFSKQQDWQAEIALLLQDKNLLEIIRDGKSFRPIGFVEGKSANNIYVKHTAEGVYIAVLNFEAKSTKFDIDLSKIGIKKEKGYSIMELLNKEKLTLYDRLPVEFNGVGAKLFRISL